MRLLDNRFQAVLVVKISLTSYDSKDKSHSNNRRIIFYVYNSYDIQRAKPEKRLLARHETHLNWYQSTNSTSTQSQERRFGRYFISNWRRQEREPQLVYFGITLWWLSKILKFRNAIKAIMTSDIRQVTGDVLSTMSLLVLVLVLAETRLLLEKPRVIHHAVFLLYL